METDKMEVTPICKSVKSCPFCGGEMIAKEELSTNNGAVMTYREISHKRPIQNCIPPLVVYSGDKMKAENIFDMWNRRANVTTNQ